MLGTGRCWRLSKLQALQLMPFRRSCYDLLLHMLPVLPHAVRDSAHICQPSMHFAGECLLWD